VGGGEKGEGSKNCGVGGVIKRFLLGNVFRLEKLFNSKKVGFLWI